MGEAGQLLLALDRKKMSRPLMCAVGVRMTAAGEAAGRKGEKWGLGELDPERKREGERVVGSDQLLQYLINCDLGPQNCC
jgi:hypothetical protein